MAANKYISNASGIKTEVQANDTSAGVGDAGKIVALNSSGVIDSTMMPPGSEVQARAIPASENLTAGDFVNLWNDAGTLKARKADGDSVTTQAHGYVLNNVTSPANATVYLSEGINTALAGLTAGTTYYLSTTAGGVTSTAPSGSGDIVQEVGVAISATELSVSLERNPLVLA